MPSQRLSIEQAAAFLQMSQQELKSLVVQGDMPCQQAGDRLYFFQDDLDTWISQQIIAFQSLKDAAKRRQTKVFTIPDTDEPFLADLCSPDTCSCDISAKSRPSMLRQLAELAVNSGFVYDPADLYSELSKREDICSTALAKGVAIPHPERRFDTPLCDDSFICIAKLDNPIFFGNSSDGSKTDIFFLVCCLNSEIHIKAIARLCRLIEQTSLLEELREATTPEELYNTLKDVDEAPKKHPVKKPISDEDE